MTYIDTKCAYCYMIGDDCITLKEKKQDVCFPCIEVLIGICKSDMFKKQITSKKSNKGKCVLCENDFNSGYKVTICCKHKKIFSGEILSAVYVVTNNGKIVGAFYSKSDAEDIRKEEIRKGNTNISIVRTSIS